MYQQTWTRWILILSFLVPFFIYNLTLLPYVGFWDTGEFQTIAYTVDIAHPTGYPTYILLGKFFVSIFNLGTVAWRMNLLSAIYVSLGLCIFGFLIKKMSKNIILSVLIPILFSVNPYLWSIAIRADPHSLHILFVSVFMYFSYEIIAHKNINFLGPISFTTGLSLGNHMLSIFLIPSLILSYIYAKNNIVQKKQYRLLLICLSLFIIGASVYVLLPITSYIKEPLTINYSLTTLQGFKRHVFGSDFQGMMTTWVNGSFNNALIYIGKLYKNAFPLYSWILIIAGFITASIKHSRFNIVITTFFLLSMYFSLRYQNASLERYFLGPFLISLLWIAVYLYELFKKRTSWIIKSTVYIFLIACIFVNYKTNYSKIDESKNTYAAEWAVSSLKEIEKDGMIFSWWSYSTPLWYVQKVEKHREDVSIINTGTGEWEDRAIESGNLNSYFIQPIDIKTEGYTLEQHGNLFKLVKN